MSHACNDPTCPRCAVGHDVVAADPGHGPDAVPPDTARRHAEAFRELFLGAQEIAGA